MTKQQFIDVMQPLYQVWNGTENADLILEDVCNTFATDIFNLDGYCEERQTLLRQCQGASEVPCAHVWKEDEDHIEVCVNCGEERGELR